MGHSVLIADDHPILLSGLKALIDADPDFNVVATAADSPYKSLKDLVEAARKNKGGVPFAIPGYGHPAHLAQMQFVRAAGVRKAAAH